MADPIKKTSVPSMPRSLTPAERSKWANQEKEIKTDAIDVTKVTLESALAMNEGDLFKPFQTFHGYNIHKPLSACKDVSGDAKIVYAVLAAHQGGDGEAYPKQETMADEAGLPDRFSAHNKCKELREKGWLDWDDPHNARLPNIYYFFWHPAIVAWTLAQANKPFKLCCDKHDCTLSKLFEQRKASFDVKEIHTTCDENSLRNRLNAVDAGEIDPTEVDSTEETPETSASPNGVNSPQAGETVKPHLVHSVATTENLTDNAEQVSHPRSIASVARGERSLNVPRFNKGGARRPNVVDEIPYAEILGYLSEKTGRDLDPNDGTYRRIIKFRWSEGKRQDDFEEAVDSMYKKWWLSNNRRGNLTPSTLWGLSMSDNMSAEMTFEEECEWRTLYGTIFEDHGWVENDIDVVIQAIIDAGGAK